MDTEQSSLFTLGIDDITQSHLISIAKWNRFLAIIGIIMSLLTILGLLFGGSYLFSNLSTFGNRYSSTSYNTGAFAGAMLFYVFFIALYLIPCFFRLSFANKMLKAIAANDQQLLNESFNQLKIFSKYWGILTIVVISIYALILIVLLLGIMFR